MTEPGLRLKIFQEAASYGDLVCIPIIPVLGLALYFVNHPDYIKHILMDNEGNYSNPYTVPPIANTLLGNGLLRSEGEFHAHQRRLIQSGFHGERIAGYAHVMVEYTENQTSAWKSDETRDIHREMMQLSMKIVARCLFGADVSRDVERVATATTALIEDFSSSVSRSRQLIPILGASWLTALVQRLPDPTRHRYESSIQLIDDLVYRIIKDRRASEEEKDDLLTMLLDSLEGESNEASTIDRQVRDEVMTLLLAGHETTASAVTWTLYAISRYPEVEAKLHAEIDDVLGGRAPRLSDLARLRYLRMVVSESLRLYPPVPMLWRVAKVDDEVGGYTIPAGAPVTISQYVMHRDSAYWKAPEEFRPERFEQEAETARPRFAYFPFGGGSRRCIGESFAWMETELLVATIAQRFRLKVAPNSVVEPEALLTLRPKHGLPMVIVKREAKA